MGRFTQWDPTGQEKNPFGYSDANPINSADPSGQAAISTIFGGLLEGFEAWQAGSDFGEAFFGSMTYAERAGAAYGVVFGAACGLGAALAGVASAGVGGLAVGLTCTAIGQTASIGAEWFYDV